MATAFSNCDLDMAWMGLTVVDAMDKDLLGGLIAGFIGWTIHPNKSAI